MTPSQKEHIQYLLTRFLDGTINTKETTQLFQYIDEEKDNEAWQEILEEFMASEQEIIINHEEYQPVLNAILQKKKTRIRTMRPWKWIAAACIIGVMSYGLWVMSERRSQVAGNKSQVAVHDVPAPTNTRAVITLADGSKVYLDSASNGTIAQENNVNVVKNNEGEIQYKLTANSQQLIAYNTLFNPRGSKVISLTLSDGTKVWLNSESSLRYPASFAPSALNREVQITGEAYFEVKHDAKQPFKVHLPNGGVIEDIGTSFNVNAYTDEADIKTTLVEGSVQLFASSAKTSAPFAFKLKPGEQAIQKLNSPNHFITTSPDIDEVLAWKNGLFKMSKTDIASIMRQVQRWYDVDVVYENGIPKGTISGEVSRNLNLSEVLKVLEYSGLHFKIEGKKITVTK
jgi:ferric-dicitrate binding protein FerR (iron transport regulator)